MSRAKVPKTVKIITKPTASLGLLKVDIIWELDKIINKVNKTIKRFNTVNPYFTIC